MIVNMKKEIVIATKNKGKVKEFKEMLEPYGYEVFSLLDFPEIGEIEETGSTFIENATIKATTASKMLNKMCIADDSGLEISALDNKPGIYSSRWLGEDTPYEEKIAYVINELIDKEDRSCRFVCAIVIADGDNIITSFEESCNGIIAYEMKGDNGFGYDPCFYYEPYNKTMAELSPQEKNEISHRGKAIKKLKGWLDENS